MLLVAVARQRHLRPVRVRPDSVRSSRAPLPSGSRPWRRRRGCSARLPDRRDRRAARREAEAPFCSGPPGAAASLRSRSSRGTRRGQASSRRRAVERAPRPDAPFLIVSCSLPCLNRTPAYARSSSPWADIERLTSSCCVVDRPRPYHRSAWVYLPCRSRITPSLRMSLTIEAASRHVSRASFSATSARSN